MNLELYPEQREYAEARESICRQCPRHTRTYREGDGVDYLAVLCDVSIVDLFVGPCPLGRWGDCHANA